MTREEAIRKLVVQTAQHVDPIELNGAEQLIRALELLGLLKLDKTPGAEGARFVNDMGNSWASVAKNAGGVCLARAINHDLEAAGFEVRRKPV